MTEDIIAYSIIVIFPLVVIFGAVLLQRRYIRNKVRKIKLLQESEERKRRYLEQQRREKQKEKEAIAELYNKGLVGRQQYDFNTDTVRTTFLDTTTKRTKYVSTPVPQIAPGTVLPQTANNFGTDLLTVTALGNLFNNTPSHAKFSVDDSDSRTSSFSSFSSSDSSSSDSGPSSDW